MKMVLMMITYEYIETKSQNKTKQITFTISITKVQDVVVAFQSLKHYCGPSVGEVGAFIGCLHEDCGIWHLRAKSGWVLCEVPVCLACGGEKQKRRDCTKGRRWKYIWMKRNVEMNREEQKLLNNLKGFSQWIHNFSDDIRGSLFGLRRKWK